MTTHFLKAWPDVYVDVESGRKTVGVRKDDQDFQVNDTLILREYDPKDGGYTDRWTLRLVTPVLRGWGIEDGYVAMSITDRLTGLDAPPGRTLAARLGSLGMSGHLGVDDTKVGHKAASGATTGRGQTANNRHGGGAKGRSESPTERTEMNVVSQSPTPPMTEEEFDIHYERLREEAFEAGLLTTPEPCAWTHPRRGACVLPEHGTEGGHRYADEVRDACDPMKESRLSPVPHDYEEVGEDYGSLGSGGSYDVLKCRVCGARCLLPDGGLTWHRRGVLSHRCCAVSGAPLGHLGGRLRPPRRAPLRAGLARRLPAALPGERPTTVARQAAMGAEADDRLHAQRPRHGAPVLHGLREREAIPVVAEGRSTTPTEGGAVSVVSPFCPKGCTSHHAWDHQGGCGHCGAQEDELCQVDCPVNGVEGDDSP